MTARERCQRGIEDVPLGRINRALAEEVRIIRGQYHGPVNHLPWLVQPVRLPGDAQGDLTIPEFDR